MRKFLFVFYICILSFTACVSNRNTETVNENKTTAKPAAMPDTKSNESAPKSTEKVERKDTSDDVSEAVPMSKAECLLVDTGDNEIVKNQTFPFNSAPFPKSCFVTSHNPEYDDPPMEAEFSIYKDGKKVFDFPDQFNGVTTGCWVDGVAFEDLNDDNLKDVVIVGKCSAKSAPYNENMVYTNTGKAFTTDEQANYRLADFKKIKEITDFVRENQQIFFK